MEKLFSNIVSTKEIFIKYNSRGIKIPAIQIVNLGVDAT